MQECLTPRGSGRNWTRLRAKYFPLRVVAEAIPCWDICSSVGFASVAGAAAILAAVEGGNLPLGPEEYYVSNQMAIPLSRMPGSIPAILPAATPNIYEKLHSVENADSVRVRRHSFHNSGKSRGMLLRPFGRRRILCGGGPEPILAVFAMPKPARACHQYW